MNDVTEKFFAEVARRVGYDAVAELYLFPVIRQSGVECAVAVIAAHPEVATPEPRQSGASHRGRHIVYTARYRNTVKGTERGKWVVDVVAEADAPLVSIEEVVRGVVRRSGEQFQPERFSGDQFRAIVPAPATPEPELA